MLSVELVVIFYRHCVRAAVCPFVAALVKSSLIETIFTPSPVGQRSTGIVVTESVCLSVYLSASISLELHTRSSPNFLCVLSEAVACLPLCRTDTDSKTVNAGCLLIN